MLWLAECEREGQKMHAEAVLVGKAESELQGLMGRIEQWRNEPGRGRSMPEALWQEASAAAQKLGVYAVSRVLRLNYQGLKRRVYSDSRCLVYHHTHSPPKLPAARRSSDVPHKAAVLSLS